MAQYQVTSWRDLPSLVVARDGDDVAKAPLPPRFQEAIDEAAMRLGASGADDYLAGWVRGPWSRGDGDAATLADTVAADLEAEWSPESVAAYLDGLTARGPATPPSGTGPEETPR